MVKLRRTKMVPFCGQMKQYPGLNLKKCESEQNSKKVDELVRLTWNET